jgi:hypothetical protein
VSATISMTSCSNLKTAPRDYFHIWQLVCIFFPSRDGVIVVNVLEVDDGLSQDCILDSRGLRVIPRLTSGLSNEW